MPSPSVPTELPAILGRLSAILEAGNNVGPIWNVGVDGIGFLLETLDQEDPFEFRSYEVQSIPTSKPRIDDETEPGEQTLAQWWARGQHSWHEGAGQRVFDSPFSSRFKFFESKGVNPWVRGELTLLKDTAELRNDAVDDHHLLSSSLGLIYTRNGNVTKHLDPDSGSGTTVTTHNGTPINSITSDGESVYLAYSGGSLGIRKIVLSTFAATVVVNAQTAVDVIGFVKGRLIGGKGASLYEYNLAVTTAPEPFHTDKASTWRWTAITESGPAIYASGFAGDRSEIYAARLTQQDIPFASVSTLGAPRSVWQAPEGEVIHTIKGYIGQQVLIGTSRGIRIGTVVSGEGDLAVSGLIAETPQGVKALEPQLEFGWFGWSTYDGTSSGLGRVDLGSFAYASDLMFNSQGEVKDVVMYLDRLYFVVDEGSTSRIIKEHATQLVVSGKLVNQDIRFATTEAKAIRFFDILATGNGEWSLRMSQNGGSYADLTTENPVGGAQEEVVSLEAIKFGKELILHRDDSDVTLGPTLHEWRLRADPRAQGKFRYLVPVMLYDDLILLNDTEIHQPGLALTLLNHLTGIYRTGRDFSFQPLESGVTEEVTPITCIMEDLRFKTYAPPEGGSGFGGKALMILREIR